MTQQDIPRLFSGIQPTGTLHLGNYLGAMQQWVSLQDAHDALYCVVDLHAITVPQEPSALQRAILDTAKWYLAAGIDPEKSTIFVQSDVPAHSELAWVLNTITQNGDLTKMTQFKDKSGFNIEKDKKNLDAFLDSDDGFRELAEEIKDLISADCKGNVSAERIVISLTEALKLSSKSTAQLFVEEFKKSFNSTGVGLFDYPVLMAADILLYDTQVVPVGEDQIQHLELARTLARRFNKRFGDTFVVPRGKVATEGARIMGLDDPHKKMSKSAASAYNYIALTDDADTIRTKIKKAVTDSGGEIVSRDDKPALKNLLAIYHLVSGTPIAALEAQYAGAGYGDFKKDLADAIIAHLAPLQERFSAISDDDVRGILADGAARARDIADAKVATVKERVGLGY